MTLLNRLLGILVVGKTVSSTAPLFMRLVLGMAVMTLLAVFAAVLLAMFVAGAVWFGHAQLLAHGVGDTMAAAIIGLSLLAIVFAVVAILQYYWQKAYSIAQQIMYLQAPVSGRITRLADAFMNGYTTKNPNRRRLCPTD